MVKDRMSLMTFDMASDLACGAMRIEDVLSVARRAEIPFVDLLDIRQDDLHEYRIAMEQTGVRLGCYISSVSFLRAEEVWHAQLRAGFSAAAGLSAKRMMIVPFSGKEDLNQAVRIGRDAVIDHMIRGFQIAVEEGKKRNIPVCFETTPHDMLCLSGTEDCLQVLRAVSGLGLVFDTANMLPHGDDPIEAYEALKPYIVHVHLKDVKLIGGKDADGFWEKSRDGRGMKCVVWGEGEIPVEEIYKRMLHDGYSGLFAIEYTHPEKTDCGPEAHLEHLCHFLSKEAAI